MSRPLRIGIVAGEASGDILGSGLIRAIKKRYPDALFEGIGGELMQAAGCRSHVPMERLSVMGLVEVLGRLPELIGVRRKLTRHFIDNPPDLFIGVDAPDFTLKMEGWLRERGILTVHYVSPSVWAWKKDRIFSIKQTTDLVLSLFPFEAKHYAPTGQNVAYVGHPLAKAIPTTVNIKEAKQKFAVKPERRIVALLPGSRGSEVKVLTEPFLDTARWLLQQDSGLRFIIPAANQQRFDFIHQLLQEKYSDLKVQLVLKHSREVMAIADSILIASGTATLEAALLKKPMVVAYKMSPITYAIYSRMINSPYVSLPNILANEALVPELFQQDVNPEVLGPAVLRSLNDEAYKDHLVDKFQRIHAQLDTDANELAADAVLGLLNMQGAR